MKEVIEKIKNKLKISDVDAKKIFQDGNVIYYDGIFICIL